MLIRAINGECGFPKGHMESNETEHETAIRELKEETNVEVQIVDGFRYQIEHQFPNKVNVMKRSVYFLGKCIEDDIVCREGEISEAMFVSFERGGCIYLFEEIKIMRR